MLFYGFTVVGLLFFYGYRAARLTGLRLCGRRVLRSYNQSVRITLQPHDRITL